MSVNAQKRHSALRLRVVILAAGLAYMVAMVSSALIRNWVAVSAFLAAFLAQCGWALADRVCDIQEGTIDRLILELQQDIDTTRGGIDP
jgi:hypothetical protein